MKCYQCGEELTNNDICANCGSDVTAYKIVVKASNSYYNQGLMKAQIRDLSGAVMCLRTSLSINKYNIKAHNLLGLVYYEMGEVVEALSEWVISKNYKPDKNAADVFIKKVQSNQNKLEAMNQTIKKFNRCLEYAKEGSDDVAKIQLKKVIQTNPKLIKAHLLLALLLMKKEEYERAKKCLSKVLVIDKNNTLAQRYIQEANERIALKKKTPEVDYTKPVVKKEKEVDRKVLSGHDVIVPKGSYKEPSNGAITVVNLLIGVAIGAALIWFLILPSRLKGVTDDNNKLVQEYIEKLSESKSQIASLTTQVDSLTAENTELKSSGANSSTQLEQYQKITDAYGYSATGKYVEAAELLLQLDYESLLSENSKTIYNQAWNNSFMAAYDSLMVQGDQAKNGGDLGNAASTYARAYAVNPTDLAAYNAGVCYMDSGDNVSAKKYLEYVVNNYPKSKYLKDTNSRLAKIG